MTKEITIDHLAEMTQRGFKDVEERLGAGIDKVFQEVLLSLVMMREDVKETKTTLGPLTRVMAQCKQKFRTSAVRIDLIEKKVGLAK